MSAHGLTKKPKATWARYGPVPWAEDPVERHDTEVRDDGVAGPADPFPGVEAAVDASEDDEVDRVRYRLHGRGWR